MMSKYKYSIAVLVLLFLVFSAGKVNANKQIRSDLFNAAIADSIIDLRIIVGSDYLNGEYMKITLQDSLVQKVIFEGKIKRKPEDYHFRMTFNAKIPKGVYSFITVTTGNKKRKKANIGIKVKNGNYEEIQIQKYNGTDEILIMTSDSPGIFD